MFDRIRKVFSRGDDAAPAPAAPVAVPPAADPVSEWAATQGFTFSTEVAGAAFALQGRVGGKPWRMEVGRPSRRYVQGGELRARAELDIDPEVLLMVMNRPLRDELVKQAYATYTESLQTSIDRSLPEEMRLLAMHDEVGWDSLPPAFWARWSLVAEDRAHALAWLDPRLAGQLQDWPAPGLGAEVPFMLMVLRGKAYLRMQHGAQQFPALQHAATVFTTACGNALGAFPGGR